MLKTALTTAFVVCSFGLAMPAPVLAGPMEDFAQRCADGGGTMVGSTCHYPGGTQETCGGDEEMWGCISFTDEDDEDEAPVVRKKFPTLFNIERKVIKKPIPHGPVHEEIMTTKKGSPAIETVETHTRSFTMKSEKVAPSAKLNLSATTTLKLKKH